MISPHLSRGLPAPVKIRHVAEVVAIVAEEHEFIVLVTKQDPNARGLFLKGEAVQVVHRKVKHRAAQHNAAASGVKGNGNNTSSVIALT